jgi:hypothetical protein
LLSLVTPIPKGTPAGAAAATATAAAAVAALVRSWRDNPSDPGSSVQVLHSFKDGGDGLLDRLRAEAGRGFDAGYLDAKICHKLGQVVSGILGMSDPKDLATLLLVIKAVGVTLGAKGLLEAPIALLALTCADVGPSLSGKWRQARKLKCAGVVIRRRIQEFDNVDAFTVSDVLVMCASLANSSG